MLYSQISFKRSPPGAFGLYQGAYKNRIYWAWDGGDYGISAQIMRFPKEKIAIIVLSNMGTGNAAGKAK